MAARAGSARRSSSCVGAEDVPLELEAALDLVLRRLERREQPLAQHPELEAVEHPVDLLAVPGGPLEVGDGEGEVEVVDEPVQPPVAQHVVEVQAQVLAGLALDLVDVGDDALEVAVLGQPLGGGLGPDPRDPRQVVAGLADERGEVAVALRRHEVPLLDRGGIHPPHLGDPPDGVEQGDLVGDELEGVAVAGADDHLVPVGDRLPGQGGDDVVGLVALDPDVADRAGRRGPRAAAGAGWRTPAASSTGPPCTRCTRPAGRSAGRRRRPRRRGWAPRRAGR